MSPATPAAAAAPELTVPAAPIITAPAAPAEPGTTAKLFADMAGSGVKGAPKAPEEVTPAPSAPVAPSATPSDVIDLASLAGKKVRLKAGEVEEVVPVEELHRRAQLDLHLTKRAQDLASKEHELNEREKTLRKPPPEAPPAPVKSPTEGSIISDDPVVQHLLKVTDELKKQNESLLAAGAPARQEQNMKMIGEKVKGMGFDDFATFRPQLEQMFNAAPAEQRALMDNESWWVSAYQTLKMKDMQAKLAAPAAPPLPARPAGGTMSDIAGGGAPPLRAANEFDVAARAQFLKAQKSGDMDDWVEYSRLDRLARAQT